MFELNAVVLGILLFVVGLGFLVLSLALLRLLPRLRPRSQLASSAPRAPQVESHSEAVLLIQRGGRVSYANPAARELFNVWEDTPNLESLARRARPSEAFLSLCAGEGQARFSLNGRFVEATSYYTSVPEGGNGKEPSPPAILISLRRPQLIIEASAVAAQALPEIALGRAPDAAPPQRAEQRPISDQAFNIFAELSQAMTSSLDLAETLKTILESTERLVPSDFLEIKVWEEANHHLAAYRLVGTPGIDRRLERVPEIYKEGFADGSADSGYSGYLVANRQPLLVKDVSTFRQLRPALDSRRYPFRSYLGVPLLVVRGRVGELVGTLEIASLAKDSYNENDLEVLRLVSGQAAVALNNALLYQEEQFRAQELAGLARLSQSVSSIRDPLDLYSQLIDSVSPLLKVEILGFLVFDEDRRVLVGESPFLGIPPDVLGWYQKTIQPGTPAETIWQSGESLLSSHPTEDERLSALELHNLAQTAGIRNMALTPLTSGGRMLGFLLVGNKADGSLLNQDDLRLLSIIAGQSAPIIENATLVRQSRRRAQRAETLRRIASLISSSATVDEILKFAVLDLARLLQADIAILFLLDESRGELRAHRNSLFGVPDNLVGQIRHLPMDDPQFVLTSTYSKQQYSSADLQEDLEIPPLLTSLVDEFKIASAVDVPLVVRERGIGELVLGSKRTNFFSPGDFQTIDTAAGQMATALEQAALYSQTDQSLRQRVEELTALTRISRELNTTLMLEPLLQRVYDEALRTTRADCGTILLFEFSEEGRISSHYEDEWPRIGLFLGDEPGVGSGSSSELHLIEKEVLREGEPKVVEDFNEPGKKKPKAKAMQPAHEGVRSAMVVPIAYQGRVAGLIHLHARSAHHFGQSELEICEALAIQAAIAVGNTHRYREQVQRTELLNRRVETLSSLLEVTHTLQSEQPLDQALEAIAYAIQSATPFNVVLISVYEPQTGLLHRAAGAGIPLHTLAELKARQQPWRQVERLMRPELSLAQAYFIPAEEAEASKDLARALEDLHTITIPSTSATGKSMPYSQAWNPDDLLIFPLFSSQGEPLGLISVDAPRNDLRPDRPTIETLEIFASQAALLIENQRKIGNLRAQVDAIQDDLEQARQDALSAEGMLPALIEKDKQQDLTIQNLSQQAHRLTAGLDIAAIVSQKATIQDIWLALGQGLLDRMGFDCAMIAEPAAGGLDLTHTLGNLPEGVNPNALLGQRNPLRHCIQSGEVLLVANVAEEEDWKDSPLLNALEAHSFICFPVAIMKVGTQPADQLSDKGLSVSALLATNRQVRAPFTSSDKELFNLLVKQVTVAFQNLALLDETFRRLREVNLLMDFSRMLGGVDLGSILKALVESSRSVIPNAQTAMVVLWDEQQGWLAPQAASGFPDESSLMQIRYRPGEGLPGQVFEEARSIHPPQSTTPPGARLDVVDFARHYNLSPDNMRFYRQATAGKLPVSSLAVPIMTGGIAPLGVLSLDSSQTTAAFSDDDLTLVTSLAQQTALTLENTRLLQAAEQRSEQLQALTGASASMTSSLQPDQVVEAMLDKLQTVLQFDTGILWLRQKEASPRLGQGGPDRMVVRAARGFEDNEQRVGLTVDVQDSLLLNEMTRSGQPIYVSDISQDARFRALSLGIGTSETEPTRPLAKAAAAGGEALSHPAFERLSWLGIPLIASGEVTGVIALEKTEANFYKNEDIQVASTFAGQAAASLENARLYQESLRHAQELSQQSNTLTILNRLSGQLSSSLEVSQILEAASRQFLAVMPATSVSVLLYDTLPEAEGGLEGIGGSACLALKVEHARQMERASQLAESPDFQPGAKLPEAPILERLRQSQGIFRTENIMEERELAPLLPFLERHGTRSLLIVPIVSGATSPNASAAESRYHGMLLAHNEKTYRFTAEEIELARTISNQLAIALQNASLYQETRNLTDDLEVRVQERTAELEREHRRSETLLRVITELSASLDLDQVLHSTLEVLKDFVDAEQITVLITRPGEKKLKRLASVGYTPKPDEEGTLTLLDADQGLGGWIIKERQSAILDNVQEDDRWVKLPFSDEQAPQTVRHQSAMGVPLMSGAEVLGCLLLFHPLPAHFSQEHLELVTAVANQVSVAVNNSELYRLIRDQAEDLGTMLRNQQVETSRTRAILEAVADGVLVTNPSQQITLFNRSAEKILGLERSNVLGRSLEHFSGLFGKAASKWMETINTWSQDPAAYDSEELFSEEIKLESDRVIQVQLAPVILRSNFLGTVSIFQDVTHQVEVDRLKSEFVATVSHELRTPMTSIKGYVEILLMGAAGMLSDQQKNFLQIVKFNTDRLAILVNDLLDVSKIEAGRVELNLQPINLEEVVDKCLDELKRRMQEDGRIYAIRKKVQANLPRVVADPERLRMILDNLLDNAYQYNTSGGEILIGIKKSAGEVQVDIKDSGVGIPFYDQPRVFERFFRGENPLAMGISGTGLGLSIVKNLVEMHHGRIWLESKGVPKEGSTFSFTLPIYQQETKQPNGMEVPSTA